MRSPIGFTMRYCSSSVNCEWSGSWSTSLWKRVSVTFSFEIPCSLRMLVARRSSSSVGGSWCVSPTRIHRSPAYARELIRWRPAVGTALVAGFVVLSAWQAVALTAPTRDAFGEMRRVSAMLREFPNDRVASDYDFVTRFVAFDGGWRWDRAIWIHAETAEARAVEFRDLSNLIVVTGGARLPWYGCSRCTANIGEFQPPSSWQLIGSIEGQPLTVYRQEPLRIWRVSHSARDPSRGQVRG